MLTSDNSLLVVACAIVGLLAGLYTYFTTWQRKGEPPVVGGHIPWLGLGAEYYKIGMPKLVDKYAKIYGDIYTVWLAGQRMTMVVNPIMFSEINKLEAKGILSPFKYRYESLPETFGLVKYRKEVIFPYWESNSDAHVYPLFMGKNLVPLTMDFQDAFANQIVKNVSKDWKEGELWNLIFALFVPAATKMFFGERTPPNFL